MARTVLIAAVDGPRLQQCTIAFCASLLKVQAQLLRRPEVQATINFFDSAAAALEEFAGKGFDACVVMDSGMGVDPSFVLDDFTEPVVIAPYPLCVVDWDRARAKLSAGGSAGESTEKPENVGNVYNVDPSKARVTSASSLLISRDDVKEMKVFKVRKGVVLAETKEVCVDLAHPAVNMGRVAYTGCVGQRKQLR